MGPTGHGHQVPRLLVPAEEAAGLEDLVPGAAACGHRFPRARGRAGGGSASGAGRLVPRRAYGGAGGAVPPGGAVPWWGPGVVETRVAVENRPLLE